MGVAGGEGGLPGPGGLGAGINPSLGGTRAQAGAGDSYGVGGLGTRGSGSGAGGNALGIGGLGTKGSGHGRGGYGEVDLGGRGKDETIFVPGRTMVVGGLSRDVINRVIQKHYNEIKYCYEKELSRHPDLYGKVTVLFLIEGTGRVGDALVQQTTMASEPVESCMVSHVRRWLFPAPQGGGTVQVTYPYVFKSSGQCRPSSCSCCSARPQRRSPIPPRVLRIRWWWPESMTPRDAAPGSRRPSGYSPRWAARAPSRAASRISPCRWGAISARARPSSLPWASAPPAPPATSAAPAATPAWARIRSAPHSSSSGSPIASASLRAPRSPPSSSADSPTCRPARYKATASCPITFPACTQVAVSRSITTRGSITSLSESMRCSGRRLPGIPSGCRRWP